MQTWTLAERLPLPPIAEPGREPNVRLVRQASLLDIPALEIPAYWGSEPILPDFPVSPVSPVLPVFPVSPVAPGEPVAPELPDAPVAPELPVAPVCPEAPVLPGAPAGPGEDGTTTVVWSGSA